MITIHRLPGRLLVIALLLAIVGAGRIARAQDGEALVEEEGIPAVAAGAVGARVVVRQVNLDQVDNMVFNRFGGPVIARTRFDAALALRIEDLERNCGLTEAQKKKLKLAGRGDVKRVFDRVEEEKRGFNKTRMTPTITYGKRSSRSRSKSTPGSSTTTRSSIRRSRRR